MTDPIRTPAEAIEAAARMAEKMLPMNSACSAAIDAIRSLTSRIAAPDDEALVELCAAAMWKNNAVNLLDWGEADKIARDVYIKEARAVIVALREAGALR